MSMYSAFFGCVVASYIRFVFNPMKIFTELFSSLLHNRLGHISTALKFNVHH